MNRTAEDLDRLAEEFRALPAAGDRKREIVAELDDVPDALPFLIAVVADPGEYDLARVEAATILRLWPPDDPATRRTAGRGLLTALHDPEEDLTAWGRYPDTPAPSLPLFPATESGNCPRSGSRPSS
ncbi:hypothetical protein ACFXPY_43340 [Streptomyces sp. NPDC059153]|uniref:hypothetical protein n=1 Tax=Streptomyces sp. NPDC059153 TaxID=3346743 RepID=UPI0036B28A6E